MSAVLSDLANALREKGTRMAKSSFVSEDILSTLNSMSRKDIDALDFGVVKADDTGNIQTYNKYESDLSGIPPSAAEGKNYFTQIAPCTNNRLFFGNFKQGVADRNMNLLFSYTFTYKMNPTNVAIHLYHDAKSKTNWILVKRK